MRPLATAKINFDYMNNHLNTNTRTGETDGVDGQTEIPWVILIDARYKLKKIILV